MYYNLHFRFYNESIRAYDILNGNVDQPGNCSDLYDVLENHEEMFDRAMAAMAKREARKYMERETEKASRNHPAVGKVMVKFLKYLSSFTWQVNRVRSVFQLIILA